MKLNDPTPVQNRTANLKARAELAGYQLYTGRDGFTITRWGVVVHLGDLDAAEKWLARVTGKPA